MTDTTHSNTLFISNCTKVYDSLYVSQCSQDNHCQEMDEGVLLHFF